MITAEQIKENWEIHLGLIDKFISEPRRTSILTMYQELGEEMIALSPASSRVDYHNSFPGGYVDHVNRVTILAMKFFQLWRTAGANISFTVEELMFSALMHDLGKLGNGREPGYVEQTDKWRKEKLGEIYQTNSSISFMLMQDRSLYLLQKYNIQCTENEFIAIKVHDGLYDDTNKPYFISYKPESRFKNHLPLILHQADLAASKIELDKS